MLVLKKEILIIIFILLNVGIKNSFSNIKKDKQYVNFMLEYPFLVGIGIKYSMYYNGGGIFIGGKMGKFNDLVEFKGINAGVLANLLKNNPTKLFIFLGGSFIRRGSSFHISNYKGKLTKSRTDLLGGLTIVNEKLAISLGYDNNLRKMFFGLGVEITVRSSK